MRKETYLGSIFLSKMIFWIPRVKVLKNILIYLSVIFLRGNDNFNLKIFFRNILSFVLIYIKLKVKLFSESILVAKPVYSSLIFNFSFLIDSLFENKNCAVSELRSCYRSFSFCFAIKCDSCHRSGSKKLRRSVSTFVPSWAYVTCLFVYFF